MDAETPSIPLARLLFSMFVSVADANDELTAREVECLNTLLDKPTWTAHPAMLAGLAALKAHYADLWRDYQKKRITRNPDDLRKMLETCLPDTAQAGLREALQAFLESIANSDASVLVRLGVRSRSAAKMDALSKVQALLGKGEPRLAGAPEAQLSTPDAQAPADVQLPGEILWPASTLAMHEENLWQRGRIRLQCVAVIPETADVKTFVFVALPGKLHRYKPGQFMTLELPIDGKTVRRSYTISSSPSRPHVVHITVKRVSGGLVSNWLHDNMTVGVEFNASGPNGHFHCFDHQREKVLLISAGSGITPVMSMLRWLTDTQSHCDIVFINNIRTPSDFVYEHELRYLSTRLGSRLRMGIIPGAIGAGQAWHGPSGRFNIDFVKMYAPDFQEREVFVCGPGGYMDNVRTTLAANGHPPARYHEESFGAAPVAANPAARAEQPAPIAAKPAAKAPAVATVAPAAPALADADKVELVFTKSGKTLSCTRDDYLLDVAEEAGIQLDSSCRAGSCGSCKVKKTAGNVDMDGQQALSEADIEDNIVLLCIGRAQSARLVLEA